MNHKSRTKDNLHLIKKYNLMQFHIIFIKYFIHVPKNHLAEYQDENYSIFLFL